MCVDLIYQQLWPIPFSFWSAFYFQFWISKCKIWLWQSWNCGIRQSGFKESRSSSLPENLHFPSTFPENSQKSYLFLNKMGLFLRLFKPNDWKQDVKHLPIDHWPDLLMKILKLLWVQICSNNILSLKTCFTYRSWQVYNSKLILNDIFWIQYCWSSWHGIETKSSDMFSLKMIRKYNREKIYHMSNFHKLLYEKKLSGLAPDNYVPRFENTLILMRQIYWQIWRKSTSVKSIKNIHKH